MSVTEAEDSGLPFPLPNAVWAWGIIHCSLPRTEESSDV